MAQREEEEASGSRSTRARHRRRIPSAGGPTPPTVTTRSRAAQLDSPLLSLSPSQRGKRKRPGPPGPSKGQERARATGSDGAAAVSSSALTPTDDREKGRKRAKAGDREGEDDEEEAAAASASTPSGPEHASSGASSAVSSPLRCPSLPRAVIGKTDWGKDIFEPITKIDRAIVKANTKLRTKYFAKRDRQLKLASLDINVRTSCFDDQSLIKIRESAAKTVLQIAKVIVGLTSYLDEKLLRQSSGFLIEWDAKTKVGTILTSTLLIKSKSSTNECLAMDEYTPDAKVCVLLADKSDTTVVANLLHYDKHYNLALFKAAVDISAQIPAFSNELKYAQEVFVLGRDDDRNLIIDHGSVDYMGPSSFLRHHYMFITCDIFKLVIGGPVINTDGEIVGMAILPEMGFIPSSIITKCLDMWKKYDCIPRLHIGMSLSAISLLDPAHIEKISRKCNVDDGFIVTVVSAGSAAEKLGVRRGDIITSWNGKNISTTVELENFLLHMCEEHLDKGNVSGSNVDLSVSIFQIRKDSHKTMNLTVNVSNDVEVVAEGSYTVTRAHCDLPCDDDVNIG